MKRIHYLPTVLVLLGLGLAITAGVVLIRRGPGLILRASPELTPRQIKITNLTDVGFTVSWITDEPTSGFIKYSLEETNLVFTASDDRDQLSGETGSFFTHHLSVKDLKPGTTYYFKIGSGKKIFDDNGLPYQVKTAPPLEASTLPNEIAYGTVFDQDGQPAKGAIVYLSLANTAPLSTLVKSSGSWAVSLNSARSSDLAAWANYDREASIEEILVQAGTAGTATAITTTKNDSPIPKITLGQNFDFRQTAQLSPSPTQEIIQEAITEASPETLPPASKFTFPEEPALTPQAELGIEILNPESGETIHTFRPEIFGRGPEGASFSLTIQSPASFSDIIQIDEKGNWSWTPPADLEPGEHTLTISYLGRTISHSFTVLAAEENGLPALTASPSGTLTPSPSPILSPSATPSPTETSTPTASPTATLPERVSIPSTEEGVPTPGLLTPTFLVFMMGIVLMLSGLLMTVFIEFVIRK